MKKLIYLLPFLLIFSCKSQQFPSTMPEDFKVEYHQDGGMVNQHRTIILQKGTGVDKGRLDGGVDYEYPLVIDKNEDLQNLYLELKKINAFALKSKDMGEVMDRGGESVVYTINGKTYEVSNSQNKFIEKNDAESFNSSISLIQQFALAHRKPEIVKTEEQTDTLSAPGSPEEGGEKMQDVMVGGVAGNDELTNQDMIIRDKSIPAKMPDDFKLKYEQGGGISGSYRIINLQYGTSTDENKPSGGSKTNKSWINKNIKDFEALYAELYKLNAFSLKYTTKGNIADRGGEKLTFTVNKKEYIVSDKDNDFISSSDKTAFKKSIALILEYVENSK